MKHLVWLGCLLLSYSSIAQVALHGLFTPIHLEKDSTIIVLDDYFPNQKAEIIGVPYGLNSTLLDDRTLLLSGSIRSKTAMLEVETEGKTQQLLLIKSSLQTITFTLPFNDEFYGDVKIIGSFNNWNRASESMSLANQAYSKEFELNPGRYEYKFFADGKEKLHPENSSRVSNGMGGFNHVINVLANGEDPTPYHVESYENDTLYLSRVNNQDHVIGFWNNQLLERGFSSNKLGVSYKFPIPEKAKKIKRSYIRIYSFSGDKQGEDLLIPLEYGTPILSSSALNRSDWHQARLYFLMVDRFKNGERKNDFPTPDKEIHPKANYMGGDLVGVTKKIEEGFFDQLNVNTVWLSPITQNPIDAWGYWNKGKVKSKFSGYHGYWPISNTLLDYRFGTEEELKELLTDAHSHGNNVILDYVANHVHISHPIYQNNKDWATNLYLPDGTKNTEKWDEHRLTTWFDDHLPTLDLRRKEVVDPMVDSALFWLTKYEFDGFRHDATKHIDELYWRTLTKKIKAATNNKAVYQIGETYGSPQLINSYISTGMLDAQFDFNLYDAAVNAFASSEGNVEDLKKKLDQSLSTYGHHHLMGNITGNQDRSRFISLASGDVRFDEDQKLAGWERNIGKPSSEAYKRLAMLHAFNNAIPGIPCIYYGDEFGMPGGGDPDNRRMMKFDDYDTDEQQLLKKVVELNKLRSTEMALLYGTTSMEIKEGIILITRKYFDQEILVLINPSELNKTLMWESDKTNSYASSFSDATEVATKEHRFSLAPLSFDYLILNTTQP